MTVACRLKRGRTNHWVLIMTENSWGENSDSHSSFFKAGLNLFRAHQHTFGTVYKRRPRKNKKLKFGRLGLNIGSYFDARTS